jgi:hypothetical protein
LRSIGANLYGTAVAAHPDVYDPLFVIGRSLVFDFPCFTAATQSFPITIASPFLFSQPIRPIIKKSATTLMGAIDFFIVNLSFLPKPAFWAVRILRRSTK